MMDAAVLRAPLTERVLHRLGQPRAVWIVLWGCLAAIT